MLHKFMKYYVDGYVKIPTWKKVKDMTVYLYYWKVFNWMLIGIGFGTLDYFFPAFYFRTGWAFCSLVSGLYLNAVIVKRFILTAPADRKTIEPDIEL